MIGLADIKGDEDEDDDDDDDDDDSDDDSDDEYREVFYQLLIVFKKGITLFEQYLLNFSSKRLKCDNLDDWEVLDAQLHAKDLGKRICLKKNLFAFASKILGIDALLK